MKRRERKWMYERLDGGLLKKEFVEGVEEFIGFAKRQRSYQTTSTFRCPCKNCDNKKFLDVDSVKVHLYKKGFCSDYYEWVCHGEDFPEFAPYALPSASRKDFPELDTEVRAAYNDKAQKRLKDIVSKAAKRSTPPKWMSADVHSGLKAKRVDPNFKIRSERALANKKSGSDGDKIDPGYRQGSISSIELAERMAQENSGVFPSAADVYVRSHSVKDKEGGRRLMSKKAEDIKARYDELREDYDELGGIKTPDQIFFDVVGGRKKGKVYGLGSSAELYYEKSSSRSSQSTASYTPSIISQLEQRVSEAHQMAAESRRMAEEQRALAETQREMYERQIAEQRNYMMEIQKQFEQFSQVLRDQCGGSDFSHSHPRDPPSDGGTGSGLAA